MDTASRALAAVCAKPIGLMAEGAPLALVGIRPTYSLVQLAGPPNPLTPRDQVLMDMGFTAIDRGISPEFTPHPAWTIKLSAAGNYEASYGPHGTQITSRRPAPPAWLTMVRTTGRCLLVWQYTAGHEVVGAEVLRDMSAGNVLAVGARYTTR
ncbi:hypothetical protein [Streptomyces sp. Midd1]|uniref:hypothetical protein n=1 Tax=Streptomyces sp. Midd3 TaxID=3161191 RepID=UPI0034DAED1F